MPDQTAPDQTAPDQTANKTAGFFDEDNGNKSAMRLMCVTSLIASIVFGALTLNLSTKDTKELKRDTSTGLYITFGFLISAFAPKAVQKFAEENIVRNKSN
jgi:hypothetical protein